jgi:hypothetical protein
MLSHSWNPNGGTGRFRWRSPDGDTDILSRRGTRGTVLAIIQRDARNPHSGEPPQAWRIVAPAGDPIGRTRQRTREAAERMVKEALRCRDLVASGPRNRVE